MTRKQKQWIGGKGHYASEDCRVLVRCATCGLVLAQVHPHYSGEGPDVHPLGESRWLGHGAVRGDQSDPRWYTFDVECRRCGAPRRVDGVAVLGRWSTPGQHTIAAGPPSTTNDV